MVWRRGGVEAGEADESGAALAAVGEFVEFPAVSSTDHVHLADQGPWAHLDTD
jgi:hypothetical protein